MANRLGFVFGARAGLFAGRAVLDMEHFSAPEHGVFCFHNWMRGPVIRVTLRLACGCPTELF
jgi:hypothetical protein